MNETSIADQDYFLLHDGAILAAHGWSHPPGHVVGEIVFLPDPDGNRMIFGKRYRKAYLTQGRGRSEYERFLIRAHTGTLFDSAHLFKCKSIVSFSSINRHIQCTLPYSDLRGTTSALPRFLEDSLTEVRQLLGEALDDVAIGLTGSLRLSLEDNSEPHLHDIDIVFTGDIQQVGALSRRMRHVGAILPAARLFEHGKGWQIRLRLPSGILCSFFHYKDPSASPLNQLLEVQTLIPHVNFKGLVVDDAHNCFLPTVLTVQPTDPSPELPPETGRLIRVIIHHMRARGDFCNGCIGHFRGALLRITTETSTYAAVSIVEGGESALMTPPWTPY